MRKQSLEYRSRTENSNDFHNFFPFNFSMLSLFPKYVAAIETGGNKEGESSARGMKKYLC